MLSFSVPPRRRSWVYGDHRKTIGPARTAHGEADLRPSPGRVRVHRRLVKDYVRERRLRSREMFVPLVHSPGHAQADFGEAMARDRRRGAQGPLPCLRSVKAYPLRRPRRSAMATTRRCVLRRRPPTIRLNTKLAGPGCAMGSSERASSRKRGSPGTKARSRDWSASSGVSKLRGPQRCSRGTSAAGAMARLRGHGETIGERLARDRQALLPLPPAPYDACDKRPGRVSSLSLVRYRDNDYSVPVAYGYREVVIRVLRRPDHRLRRRGDSVIGGPFHYLPGAKIGALDHCWTCRIFATLPDGGGMGKAGKRESSRSCVSWIASASPRSRRRSAMR